MMMMPPVIRTTLEGRDSRKEVMDGILKSAMLTETQRQDIAGIIKSSLPEKQQNPKVKVEPSKTIRKVGVVHYPGSKFH